ncbi:MAG TPA: DUF962 domain-containing protein [Magnetospirillaceae bacterium]|nr:DUF962 domain-containing protein [Magnetospirillaceae bacterium]
MKNGERLTFAQFWPTYLREHANPATRAMHIGGTLAALACIVAAIVTRNPWWLLIALAAGYGLAWIGHFFIEKNRPATFSHPFLSLAGDFTMLGYALRGTLGDEVRKATQGLPPGGQE